MWGKFSSRVLKANQRQSNGLRYSPPWERRGMGQTTQIATLVVLLGLGSNGWVANRANAQSLGDAIVPENNSAQTKRIDISLDRQKDEPYENFIKRAELAARQAIQASFAQEEQATDVSVTIMGQHLGHVAPVLEVDVRRSQWQNQPDLRNWSTYFASARSLLRFDQDLANTNQSNTTRRTQLRSNQTRTSIPNNRRRQDSRLTNSGNRSTGFTQPGTPTPVIPGQPPNIAPFQTQPSSNSTGNTGIFSPQVPQPAAIPNAGPQNPRADYGSGTSNGVIIRPGSSSSSGTNTFPSSSPNNSSGFGVTPN